MVLGFWSRIGYDSVLPLVATRGDPGDLNEATALQDAYRFAGVPWSTCAGFVVTRKI
jgi:hypothetical protein